MESNKRTPGSIWKWFVGTVLGLCLVGGLTAVWLWQVRVQRSTRQVIERLAELISEPSLADGASPMSERFSSALATLARERGISPERLKADFERFDSGIIPGLRPAGYEAALADLAESRFATALREARECGSAENPRTGSAEGRCHLLAGEILLADGKLEEAEEQFRLAGTTIDGTIHARDHTVAKLRLADALQQQKHYTEAEPLWRDALASNGAHELPASTMLLAQTRLGQLLLKLERPEDAEPILAKAETDAHTTDLDPLVQSRIFNEHGLALMQLNRASEAETSFRNAFTLASKNHDPALAAVLSGNLGFAIGRQGRLEEAEPLVRTTVDFVDKAVRENPYSIPARESLAAQLRTLADVLRACGKYQEEESVDHRLYDVIKSIRGSENLETAEVLIDLAFCQRQLDAPIEAEKSYHQAIDILELIDGADHLRVARPLNDLAVLLRDQGRYTEAVHLLKRAMEIMNNSLPPGDPRRAVTMGNLGLLMAYTGEADQGETLIRRAISLQHKVPGPPDLTLASMFNNLAEAMVILGRRENAAPYYGKALSITADLSRRTGHYTTELERARENYKACLKVLNTPEDEIARKVKTPSQDAAQ